MPHTMYMRLCSSALEKKIHRIEIEGSTWLNIYGHTSPDRIYFFKGQNDESSVMS